MDDNWGFPHDLGNLYIYIFIYIYIIDILNSSRVILEIRMIIPHARPTSEIQVLQCPRFKTFIERHKINSDDAEIIVFLVKQI